MRDRKFTSEDQDAFAELSGDFNPLHVDAIVARRLLFGTQVVHGLHALLWALDCNFKDHEGKVALSSIKSTFLKPIRVGDSVSFFIEEEVGGKVQDVVLMSMLLQI